MNLISYCSRGDGSARTRELVGAWGYHGNAVFFLKWFSLAVLIAVPSAAQFHDLSTDDTGNRVWFSSPLRLRGTDQQLYDKLFTADADGHVTLLLQRPPDNPYHLLNHPEVSGDGRTLVYLARYYCPPQITCRVDVGSYGVMNVPGQSDIEVTGSIHLSRNGRYVIRDSYRYLGPTDQVEMINLQTGARHQIPVANFLPISGGRQVASNGSALVYADGLWLIRFDGSFQPVPTWNFGPSSDPQQWFPAALRATMDDSASIVVFQTMAGTPGLGIVRPDDSSSLRTLVSAEEGCTNPVMSADGRRVLFLSRANFSGSNTRGLQQAWIVSTDSGAIQMVTNDPAGIEEATLSGDGTVVWASTFAGRLLWIQVDTSVVREIIPWTTAVDSDPLDFPIRAAPGSLAQLTGRGLSSQQVNSGLPLVTELSGVRLLADGTPLPLLFVSPTEIGFQVPWEMRERHTLTLAPTQSPFEDQLTRQLQVVDTSVVLLKTADGQTAIAHDDFHGLVTPNDPARPGEVLHLYLTGLGAVDPPVATGEAAPVAPLSTVTDRVSVYWAGSVLPAPPPPLGPEVLFAGLAPGMVGIYQVDIRLPANAPLAELGISIQVGNTNTIATFPVGAP